jgi:hypothetical protein
MFNEWGYMIRFEMRQLSLWLLLASTLVGCMKGGFAARDMSSADQQTQSVSPGTPTASPTATPLPNSTPTPTATPTGAPVSTPTATPRPTSTPTPTPVAGSGKTYYVSPTGSDTNNGTSANTPWQTVAKVNASSFGPGDSLLFQAGQTFTGCLNFSGSKVSSTTSNIFTVSSYGNGRFTLNSNCPGKYSAAVTIDAINGITIENAVISGAGTATQYGVWIENTSATQVGQITVQNCDISGFLTTDTSTYSSEIWITGYEGGNGGLNHINILNNTIHGANGIGSLEDNALTGYGDGQNILNVVYSGNTIYNIGGRPGVSSGNGLIAIGVDDGLIEHNVVHDMAANANTCGGAAGLWAYGSNNITIQYNEVYNVRPTNYTSGCDWDGFDLDGMVTNSTVQYNYAHDNWGAGYLAYVASPWTNNTYRYNIGQNNGISSPAAVFGEVSIGGYGTGTGLQVYNNTFYSNTSTGALVGFQMTGGSITGTFSNNIFYSEGGAYFINSSWSTVNGAIDFTNNDFFATSTNSVFWNGKSYATVGAWATATGLSSNELIVNPMLNNPGKGGIIGGYVPTSLTQYELMATSPLIGVGLIVSGAGSSDYFGHSLSTNTQGTTFNIGADGSAE